jgi:hypothetical protein
VGPCFFALPGHVRFEPEALEMCDQLVVAVERQVSNESLSREHASFDLAQATEITGRRREITAPFDESRIWKHYTEVDLFVCTRYTTLRSPSSVYATACAPLGVFDLFALVTRH